MKRNIFIILSAVLIPFCAISQTLEFHWPQDGDRVVKTQYEFVAVACDSAVWDFSHAVEMGQGHAMRWANLGDSVLVRVERGNQYTYRTQGDTLLWLGYENALLGLRDSVAPIAWLPGMAVGDSVVTPCYFKGRYSGNHAVDMAGTHTVWFMGRGTLILPNDTIANALLVHEVTDTRVRVSPDATAAPIHASQDSLLRHVEVTDRWYSPVHRYPVAENVTGSFYARGELLRQNRVTFLCGPDVQELALGELTQAQQTPMRLKQGAAQGDNDNNLPLGDRLAVSVSGGQVAVAVSGVDGMGVNVTLSDLQGRVWSSLAGKTQGGVWQGAVGIGQLPTGDYLLHVAVGEDTHVERVRIK